MPPEKQRRRLSIPLAHQVPRERSAQFVQSRLLRIVHREPVRELTQHEMPVIVQPGLLLSRIRKNAVLNSTIRKRQLISNQMARPRLWCKEVVTMIQKRGIQVRSKNREHLLSRQRRRLHRQRRGSNRHQMQSQQHRHHATHTPTQRLRFITVTPRAALPWPTEILSGSFITIRFKRASNHEHSQKTTGSTQRHSLERQSHSPRVFDKPPPHSTTSLHPLPQPQHPPQPDIAQWPSVVQGWNKLRAVPAELKCRRQSRTARQNSPA